MCPAQGSQSPGFLAPWLDFPGMTELLTSLSETAGMDLVAHGTTSDEATIKDTAIAQPLLVGAGLVALHDLADLNNDAGPYAGASLVSGHSVGEITAAAAVGVLTPHEAMAFVTRRGQEMAKASALVPTGMSAVLGGDPAEVLDAIARHGLTPANVNGAGQVVAAGTLEHLAALAADPPAKARIIPLKVAGAFHSTFMEPAARALRPVADALTPHDATIPIVSNKDGAVVSDGRDILDRLVGQINHPVRWDLCMERFVEVGVTAILELPPAGTLTGLAKRAIPGVHTLAVKSPDDLPAARALIQEYHS